MLRLMDYKCITSAATLLGLLPAMAPSSHCGYCVSSIRVPTRAALASSGGPEVHKASPPVPTPFSEADCELHEQLF